MNYNPDYNSEMLKLYFFEKGFNEKEIKEILNKNPFGYPFTSWEKKQLETNQVLAKALRVFKLINQQDNIHEIVNDKYNSISKYLLNNVTYSNNIKDFINKNSIILIRDTIRDDVTFAEELAKMPYSFITGICTNNKISYLQKKEMYKKLKEKMKSLEITDVQSKDLRICLIKKCR